MINSRFSIRSTTKKIERKPTVKEGNYKSWLSMYRSNFFIQRFYEIVTEFDYNISILKWY